MYISVRNNTNAADLYWKYTFVYEKSSLEIDKIIKRLRRETIKKNDFLCYRYILLQHVDGYTKYKINGNPCEDGWSGPHIM